MLEVDARAMSRYVTVVAVVTLLASVRLAVADAPIVAVGVISPEQGRSGSTGLAHRASIEWAFEDIHHYVLAGNQHVTLPPIYADDHGDPEESVRVARRLVNEEHVVALLGPANSGCTDAVLRAQLEVPVISSLSSAPSLTTSRNEWFFRATIDDHVRMQRYASFLRAKGFLGNHSLLLYEDDVYGQGLATSLTESLGAGDTQMKKWQEVTADPEAFVASLPGGAVSVFVLGTEGGAVDVANQVANLAQQGPERPDGAVRFFFVGGGNRLVQEAPDKSVTIGEPVPEADAMALLDVPGTVAPFIGRRDFLLTAYEAARFVLPKALEYALASGVSPDDLPGLRGKLKAALDSKSFDSLTPWRKIKFDRGNLVEPPSTPIYQLNRMLERLDPPPPAPWLSVVVAGRTRFLEEPVAIAMEERGSNGEETVQLQVLDDSAKVVDSSTVALKEGKGAYTFHPSSPGRFHI